MRHLLFQDHTCTIDCHSHLPKVTGRECFNNVQEDVFANMVQSRLIFAPEQRAGNAGF